ncbi:hypothetical protein [Absidia glauca]|uniref:Uncharacterized protein n=1 Tax=Absidia glauca TaxID=4829 RepID=A0A168LCB1_ABSGL|nr:hypothetical protein [Absidia glauca]
MDWLETLVEIGIQPLHERRAATSLPCGVPEYTILSLGVGGMGRTLIRFQPSLQYGMPLMIGRAALVTMEITACYNNGIDDAWDDDGGDDASAS